MVVIDTRFVDKRWGGGGGPQGLIEMMKFGVQQHIDNKKITPCFCVMPHEIEFIKTYMSQHYPKVPYQIRAPRYDA